MRLASFALVVVLSLTSGVRVASAATIGFKSAAATQTFFYLEDRFTLDLGGYHFQFNYLGVASGSQHGSIALWNHNAALVLWRADHTPFPFQMFDVSESPRRTISRRTRQCKSSSKPEDRWPGVESFERPFCSRWFR